MSLAQYVVTSLPGLQFGQPPPMTMQEFIFQCTGVLSEEQVEALQCLSNPMGGLESANPLVQQWAWSEAQIRNALSRARQSEWGSEAKVRQEMHSGWSVLISKTVSDAISRNNPLESEQLLDTLRWELAQEIALSDPYGFAGIFAWGICLQVAHRWHAMDADMGMQKLEELIDQKDKDSWQ